MWKACFKDAQKMKTTKWGEGGGVRAPSELTSSGKNAKRSQTTKARPPNQESVGSTCWASNRRSVGRVGEGWVADCVVCACDLQGERKTKTSSRALCE